MTTTQDFEPCPVARDLAHPGLALGVLVADGLTVAPADADLDRVVDAAIRYSRTGPERDETLRQAVRDMLRVGGFKPTGRNKPSSEYIANAAARGAFPRINNVVDIANVVSLESGLPISLLDRDRAEGESAGLEIRFGNPGEAHVFNASGQEIDVSGLVSIARAGGPAVGNPVKDAMSVKTDARTTRVLAVVYAPGVETAPSDLQRTLELFATRLEAHAGAIATRWWILLDDGMP